MGKKINYLKYVLEHKKNVFKECISEGMLIHAITHDLSKFSYAEFEGYANFDFQGENSDKAKKKFEIAWLHHQKKNKHHWDYWVNGNGKPVPMPYKYVMQMICDWRAMSVKFADTPQMFYLNKRDTMALHQETIRLIEIILFGMTDEEYYVNCCMWEARYDEEREKWKDKVYIGMGRYVDKQ